MYLLIDDFLYMYIVYTFSMGSLGTEESALLMGVSWFQDYRVSNGVFGAVKCVLFIEATIYTIPWEVHVHCRKRHMCMYMYMYVCR